MPVKVKKIGGKFRIVENKTNGISTNKGGTAVDGGGHSSRERAMAQAAAINANYRVYQLEIDARVCVSVVEALIKDRI